MMGGSAAVALLLLSILPLLPVSSGAPVVRSGDLHSDTDRVMGRRAKRQDASGTWTATEFTDCSAACGGGFRVRSVRCLDVDGVISRECSFADRPASYEFCNQIDCITNDPITSLPPFDTYNFDLDRGASAVLEFQAIPMGTYQVVLTVTEVDGTETTVDQSLTDTGLRTSVRTSSARNRIEFEPVDGSVVLLVDRERILGLEGVEVRDVEGSLRYSNSTVSISDDGDTVEGVDTFYYYDGLRFYRFTTDKMIPLNGSGVLYVNRETRTALFSTSSSFNDRLGMVFESLGISTVTPAAISTATPTEQSSATPTEPSSATPTEQSGSPATTVDAIGGSPGPAMTSVTPGVTTSVSSTTPTSAPSATPTVTSSAPNGFPITTTDAPEAATQTTPTNPPSTSGSRPPTPRTAPSTPTVGVKGGFICKQGRTRTRSGETRSSDDESSTSTDRGRSLTQNSRTSRQRTSIQRSPASTRSRSLRRHSPRSKTDKSRDSGPRTRRSGSTESRSEAETSREACVYQNSSRGTPRRTASRQSQRASIRKTQPLTSRKQNRPLSRRKQGTKNRRVSVTPRWSAYRKILLSKILMGRRIWG